MWAQGGPARRQGLDQPRRATPAACPGAARTQTHAYSHFAFGPELQISWACEFASFIHMVQRLPGLGAPCRPARRSPHEMKQPPRRSREFANAASSCEHLAFCRRLPKVELSAHLNGCVRDSTLRCGQGCCRLPHQPMHLPRGHAAVPRW